MSKYNVLWQFIKESDKEILMLTFAEIKDILGFEIDHSFLTFKPELENFGFKVDKILLKQKVVTIKKIKGN